MNIRDLNIKDASSAALETLMQDISVELQDRMYIIYEDALTHGLEVDEVEEPGFIYGKLCSIELLKELL